MHPDSYVADEGDPVDICVQLTGQVEREVTVTISTVVNGDANGTRLLGFLTVGVCFYHISTF